MHRFMLIRNLRRAQRLSATLLAMANLPRPPARPENIDGNWEYFKARLRWRIRREMAKSSVPGLSIAVVDDRQTLWAEGFGWSDREHRQPATADTVYQIGSITKVVTALAILQLQEQGRLSLDQPLSDFLPEFRMQSRWPNAAPVTLRSLLSHHAGLPTYYLKGFFSETPLQQLLEELREEHFAYEPHTVFNYSNLGFNLLGLVLERLHGQPYVTAITRHLLDPLGMQHSGFTPTGPLADRLARGYVYERPSHPTRIRDLPAGGLYSTVQDVARFMRMVLGGGTLDGTRVLGEAALGESLKPQYPDCPLDFGQKFGLGWILSGLRIDSSGSQAWHNGGTKAFLSQMAILPEMKLGVVVMANSDRANALVLETAEAALQLALEVRHGVRHPVRPLAPELTLPRADLERRVGDYSLMGSLARISLGRKRLRLHVLHHKLDLVPVSENRFRVEYNLLGLKSVPIPFPPIEFAEVAGRPFAVLQDRVIVPAEKIPSYPIPPTWTAYTGEYQILNPDAEYLVDLEHCRVEIADGRLLLDLRISGIENREVKVVLVPLNDHDAYVFGLGRNVGDVAHTYNNHGRYITRYSGYLFGKLD
jgi:CubicO group peptidase (beta-lactamase class C family)